MLLCGLLDALRFALVAKTLFTHCFAGQGCHPHSEGMPGAYHNLAPMSPSRQGSIKTRLCLARIHFKWKSLSASLSIFLFISLSLSLPTNLSMSAIYSSFSRLNSTLDYRMKCKGLKIFKIGSQPAPQIKAPILIILVEAN